MAAENFETESEALAFKQGVLYVGDLDVEATGPNQNTDGTWRVDVLIGEALGGEDEG